MFRDSVTIVIIMCSRPCQHEHENHPENDHKDNTDNAGTEIAPRVILQVQIDRSAKCKDTQENESNAWNRKQHGISKVSPH